MGEVAKALGKPFLPWQQHVADVALEIDPDTGLPAYSEVDVVVMRQQGKSELLFPLMTHRALATGADGWGGPQRIMYLAQTADAAREKWREIHYERLKKSPFRNLFEPRFRLGQESFTWTTGSVWSPGSTTGKTAGTGDTLDLGLIDEAWSHESGRTELGMRPTMQTRPKRQLWVVSMIPGLSRTNGQGITRAWPYLKNKRRAGRARVEAGVRSGVAYFEWAAPDDSDPADPATWWSCMPALGYTISEKVIREDFEAFDLVDFEAEYLSREPSVTTRQWQTVSESTWEGLLDTSSAAGEPVAFGISSTNERSWTSIVVAAPLPDGNIHIELVDRQPGVSWAVARMSDLVRDWDPCAVAVARGDQAVSIVQPLTLAHPELNIYSVAGPDVASACGRWFDATGELPTDDDDEGVRRLRHLGQPEMTQAASVLTQEKIGTRWQWSKTASDVDISPVYGATMAMWAGDQVDWLGGAYNIADTLG